MTAWDAFTFSEIDASEIEERYTRALDVAESSSADEVAERLLVELLQGLSDVEKKALALGIMVGRLSR